jgi:hypothetical protein
MTSPAMGGRSVGIVRSRTVTREEGNTRNQSSGSEMGRLRAGDSGRSNKRERCETGNVRVTQEKEAHAIASSQIKTKGPYRPHIHHYKSPLGSTLQVVVARNLRSACGSVRMIHRRHWLATALNTVLASAHTQTP